MVKNDQEIRLSIRTAIDDCTRGIDEAPSLQFRIAQKVRGEKKVNRKTSVRIICVIAALLLGTMTALAAGMDDINAILFDLWPEAARALRPLNLSSEQGGIRLDVISATLNEDHYLVTYSLTDLEGDRINEDIVCNPMLEIPMEQTNGRVELISYDPEKHQAVYGAYFEYTAFPGISGPQGADQVCLSVAGLEKSEKTNIDLWPLMADQHYTAEAVPVPSDYPWVDTFVWEGEPVRTEATAPDVLNPANNLHIPLMGSIELSGIGWIDGNLHVQLHVPDNKVTTELSRGTSFFVRYASVISLLNREGREVMYDWDFYRQRIKDTGEDFVWSVEWWDGDDYWLEKIFPVRQEEMDGYVIDTDCIYMRSGVEDLLQYEWVVSFPANMILTEK